MDDALYIPSKYKDRKVNVILSSPIAVMPTKEGPIHMACGAPGTLLDISPAAIVLKTEHDSIFGPPGEYAISKKCLLSCGVVSSITGATAEQVAKIILP